MPEVVLELQGVSAGYGAIRAIEGVSFTVRQGEIVALIGANGAGKTSTLRAILGLIVPTAGRILLAGEEITGLPPHKIVARGVAMVPEGRGIFPELTVLENLEVATSGRPDRRNRAAVRRDMERVFEIFPRLADRKRQLGGTLSGGEQQMLALGRALMIPSRIMLLDEPSMGLAPNLVQEIFAIIERMGAEGRTILMVEQNAYQALAIAHAAHVLETGRIRLSGSPEELRREPHVRAAYLGA